ncbi:hypothetical protein [Nitrosomonas oligotropha]|uniref:hypothetical protein n=1 Tax=Nitrosomonas oligotropha TaxID=42354 RepID=UPI0013704528|nr:hypothetical protein [Nitrosomonas oligotropha]MXS83971.1 hypothetical protein [Nitrosomonas oligotropha]
MSQINLANVMRQNPDTLQFEVDEVAVDLMEKTWFEFQAITTFYDIYYFVKDLHSVGSSGGSLWRGDSVANKASLHSGPVRFPNFPSAPNPASWPGLRVWIETGVGIGGVEMLSRDIGGGNYRYRYAAGRALLKFRSSDISKTSNKDTEEALEGCLLPRNNNRNIMQNGDVLMLVQHARKTGTANNFGRDFRVGPNGPGANILLDASVGDAVATGSGSNISDDEVHRFKRISATSFKKMGPKFSTSTAGFASTARSAAVPVANMDDADTYFSSTFWLPTVGATDTQILEDWYLELIHAGG